eukprot:gene55042-75415_t
MFLSVLTSFCLIIFVQFLKLTVVECQLLSCSSCCGLKNVTIPTTVSNIASYAFDHCGGGNELVAVVISTSVTYIGRNAFSNNSVLRNVTFSTSVAHISDLAFDSCPSLHFVNIPASVTDLSPVAFQSRVKLTFVAKHIPTENGESTVALFSDYHHSSLLSTNDEHVLVASTSYTTLASSANSPSYCLCNYCCNCSHVIIPTTTKSIASKVCSCLR